MFKLFVAAALAIIASPATAQSSTPPEPDPLEKHGVMDWSSVDGYATGVNPNEVCALLLDYQAGTGDDDNLVVTVAINTHAAAYPDLVEVDRSYMVGVFVGCLATDDIGETD
jgi:hypothetical protein